MGILGESQFPFAVTILAITVVALAINIASPTMIIMLGE
jgi:hypothetical protein